MSVHIDNFETIFGVKDNIQALRNKVLELAIQGKLVKQDSNDEPAVELIKRIKEEKEQLIKDKIINKAKKFPTLTENLKYIDIPENWEWIRFDNSILYATDYVANGSFASLSKNVTTYKEENYAIMVRTTDFSSGFSSNLTFTDEKGYNFLKKSKLYGGEFMLSNIGASIGKAFIIPNLNKPMSLAPNSIMVKSQNNTTREYLKYLILSDYGQKILIDFTSGTAMPKFNKTQLRAMPIPFPPLGEQQRIVNKIESLMSEIDKLEEFLQKKEHLMELLPKAVVEAIGSCNTGEELKKQLEFVIENFKTVFQTPNSMQELRNVVLQLAIEGKLVPQDIDDEPASELVKKIKVEKNKLLKDGKIKKQKPLKPVMEDEIPFEIPESWEWVRLRTLSQKVGDGLHGTPIYSQDGEYYFINGNNLSDTGIIIRDNTKRVNIGEYEKYKKPLNNRTIFVSINGTLGNVAYYNDEKVILGKSACYFNLYESILKDYIKSLIKGTYFLTYANEKATGTTIKNLSLKSINLLPIPLPPIIEQHRIVQKIESLMILINQMEVQLKQEADLVKKLAV